MLFTSGYKRVGTWRKTPVMVHWSLGLLLLVVGLVSLNPVSPFLVFAVLGFRFGVKLLVASLIRASVVRVDWQATGGEVRLSSELSSAESRLFSWVGLMVQLWLLVMASLILVMANEATRGAPDAGYLIPAVRHGLIYTNGILLLINLLPVAGSDGEFAWSLKQRQLPTEEAEGIRQLERWLDPQQIQMRVEGELAQIVLEHHEKNAIPRR